jgi:cytochrome oxidase Cu insertion factor (SCO1/SenC/PrrC family)
MKKLLLTLFLLGGFITYAQDNINERCLPEDYTPSVAKGTTSIVGDFTITDSQGVTCNLYDQLDLGNTVIIDLFFTT